MPKRVAGETYCLNILNLLMTHDYPLSTTQICDMVGCERKTVYAAMDRLEISGFGIDVINGHAQEPNRYRLRGIYRGRY